MALEFAKDDLEYIKETLEWLNKHTVLIEDNRTNCETEHSRTVNSLIAIERGLAQCSDENAALPLQSITNRALLLKTTKMKRPKITDAECKRLTMSDIPIVKYSKLQDKYIDYLEAQAKQLRISGASNCAFAKGDRVIVFDAVAWNKVGKDVGDNSCFHKEATILEIYYHNSEIGSSDWCAKVKFDDGRISKGHFLWGLEHCY